DGAGAVACVLLGAFRLDECRAAHLGTLADRDDRACGCAGTDLGMARAPLGASANVYLGVAAPARTSLRLDSQLCHHSWAGGLARAAAIPCSASDRHPAGARIVDCQLPVVSCDQAYQARSRTTDHGLRTTDSVVLCSLSFVLARRVAALWRHSSGLPIADAA